MPAITRVNVGAGFRGGLTRPGPRVFAFTAQLEGQMRRIRKTMSPAVKREVARELDFLGQDITDFARGVVSVDTGYLRSTIGYRVDRENLEMTAFAGARYAIFVERRRPFLAPAVTFSLDRFPERVFSAVERAAAETRVKTSLGGVA